MSIFDNIVFDEFALLEGYQAEEYKERKAKEKEEQEKKEKERNSRRYDYIHYTARIGSGVGNKHHKYYPDDKDLDRHDKANEIIEKELDNRVKDYHKASDKYNSHVKYHHPGERPTGVFKGKQKKEYDKKLDAYNKKEKDLKKDLDDKNKKFYEIEDYKFYDKDETYDTVNRHIRRHPKQYKESVFEDIEMI